MISKEWLEYYQKKFNGKNGDCISYRPNGFEIIKKDLEEKEKQDEILKHLDFSDGAIMTGFDYNEKQIVAMPLSEYDRLMKIEEHFEKQDRILNTLLKKADYQYDECYGIRGHQCIMISKDAVELAYTEFQKYLDDDTSNQWLKNVIEGLKCAEKDLERLEAIENAKPSETLRCLDYLYNSKMFKYIGDEEHFIEQYHITKHTLIKAQEQEKILQILKDKEVDVNFFKTLIPFHKGEELMMKYNETRWKGKLTLEETIKIKEWLDGKEIN